MIYVVYKKQRNSADYLMLNLALSDLLFGILIVPKNFKYTINGIDKDIVNNRFMCTLFMRGMLPYTAMLSSISTMMILTLERHFAICHPHSFKKWFSTEKVKMYIVVSWMIAIIYHIPYCIKVECRESKEEEEFTKGYSVLTMVLAVLELVFLIILSTKIYLSLWHKQSIIHPSAIREIEKRKRKKKITLCVLTVVGSFVFCYIPYFIIQALAKYDIINAHLFGMSAKKLTDLFLVLNAAVDPYLYTCQNTRLRALLRKVMLCGRETTGREQERPCTT